MSSIPQRQFTDISQRLHIWHLRSLRLPMLPQSVFWASLRLQSLQLQFVSCGTTDRRHTTSRSFRTTLFRTSSTRFSFAHVLRHRSTLALSLSLSGPVVFFFLLALLHSRPFSYIALHWHCYRATTHDATMSLRPYELTFGAFIWP